MLLNEEESANEVKASLRTCGEKFCDPSRTKCEVGCGYTHVPLNAPASEYSWHDLHVPNFCIQFHDFSKVNLLHHHPTDNGS